MTRRGALLAFSGALAAARAQVQYRAYHRCLPDYLSALAREATARRDKALASMPLPDRQRWVRETFWKLAGGQPERSPLNVRTTGSFEREGYRLEKLTYESQPGLVIPANLYIPTQGRGPFPGVLFQMGHSLNGKAAEPYQKCCQALARLGYVVLGFDPMGQGERTYIAGLDNADEQHSRPGRQMLLVGDTATRMQTWDAVRSLDVLASHPSVDPKRLASTGQSGGGTLTMFLTAVDDRLACAAVSCGNTENLAWSGFLPPGSTDDAEQNFLDSGPLGFDRWDTLYPHAPKPLWIAVSGRDWFGTYSPAYLENGRAEFARLKSVYEKLGHADRIEWYETAVPHALSHDLRVRIYRFFERHLKGSTARVEEPPVKADPDEVLLATKGGLTMPPIRSTEPNGKGWEELLRVDRPRAGVKPSIVARAKGEGCDIEGVEIQTAEHVFVPAWVYIPRAGERDKVMLALEPRGRNGRWREGDLYHRLAAEGWTVVAFDVRGVGDMWPEVGHGNPFYTKPHNDEEAWTWASMMLGKPLLGQRVTDVLGVAKAMRGKRTVLAATGHVAIPAVCAAALDPKIESVYAVAVPSSWGEPFANAVPSILKRATIGQVKAQLGPRLSEGKRWDLESLRSL